MYSSNTIGNFRSASHYAQVERRSVTFLNQTISPPPLTGAGPLANGEYQEGLQAVALTG